jgi:hypothetical protein
MAGVTLDLDLAYIVRSGSLQHVAEYHERRCLGPLNIKAVNSMRASVIDGKMTDIYQCVFNTAPDRTVDVPVNMITDRRMIDEYR